jgi:signal transduction histidine kinase
MDEISHLREENKRLSRELEQRLFELSVLYAIGGSISETLDYATVLQLLMDSLPKIFDCDVCTSLLIPDERSAKMVIKISRPMPESIVKIIKSRVVSSLNHLRDKEVFEQDVKVDIQGQAIDQSQDAALDIRSSFDVPFYVNDKAVGVLNISSTKDIAYTDDQVKLLYALVTQVSMTIERIRGLVFTEKVKMKILLERMSEGVVMLDEHDELVVLNAVARDMLGYYEADLDARMLLKSLQDIKVIETYEEIKQSVHSPWIKEYYYDNPYPRIIRLEALYLRDVSGNPQGIAMILRDVTKAREVDQMKNEFVSLVSHELRTPLAAMKGATDNMLEGITGELNSVQQECLSIIKRNIERLNRLISDLLDISRIEAGKLQLHTQSVQINQLVQECLHGLEELGKQKNIVITASLAEDMPPVSADPDKIIQVVTNLIGNAVKFTPPGGKVSVETAKRFECVQVSISDTGVGISHQDLEKVFDKFYQVTNNAEHIKVKGTGLGLPISKGIIERHQGKIWAESVLGKGSTFIFTLPFAAL